MKKKLLYVLLVLLFISICFSIYVYFHDSTRFYLSYTIYNYFPYENGKYIKVDIPVNNKVQYLRDEEIFSFFESGTGVIYFGYPECPWCRNIVGPLTRASLDTETLLYYVDVHKLTNRDKLFKILDEYLKEDDEGNKKLYVPDVYFVKDGKILSHHLGSVDSYKNPYLGMNEEQEKELISIYKNEMNKLKMEES